jgi:hypothetical protein
MAPVPLASASIEMASCGTPAWASALATARARARARVIASVWVATVADVASP